MYVAVKGGERAIENAHRLLAHERRGDRDIAEVSLEQISGQLGLAVDRVMSEGSLYDRELAALAIKQARGDLIEAIFLVRAFRATLPRLGATEPVDTGRMRVRRRVSSTFKDIPGGQILVECSQRAFIEADAGGCSFLPAMRGPCRRSPGLWRGLQWKGEPHQRESIDRQRNASGRYHWLPSNYFG